MLYLSNGTISRRARRWAWVNRPLDIDNPVKRYLRNRPVNRASRTIKFVKGFGRQLRPAF